MNEEIKKRILAIAPEAKFNESLHDEIVIECYPEHQEAVVTAAISTPTVWTKYAKLAVDSAGLPVE